MKDLNTIKTLTKVLVSQKTKIQTDLSHLNAYIEKKLAVIKKFILYQNEYYDDNNLKLTKATPLLSRNLEIFSTKIKDIICNEEREVTTLTKSKQDMISKLDALNEKIKVLNEFEKTAKDELIKIIDKIEQNTLDDLAALKKHRGEYE